MRKHSKYLSSVAVAAILATPVATLPTAGWATIDEVVVTTRKREENLQEVPVAVAAFSADLLESQGLRNTQDILKLVPGVQFDQAFGASDTRISMRGINASRGRASVAVLVDGVDVSGENINIGGGSSLLNTALLDLERVEIVKGPQSALYGRNAFAGAINYITKKPSMDGMEGNLSVDVGEHGKYEVRGVVSGPVVADKLALRLNAATYNLDGYYEDPSSGGDLNGAESDGIRLAALFTPTENITINANVAYTESKSSPRAVVKVGKANTFYSKVDGSALPGLSPDDAFFTAFSAQGYGQWLGTVGSVEESDINLSQSVRPGFEGDFQGSEDERLSAALDIEWDLGSVTLRSITGYLDNEASAHEDVDFQDGPGTVYIGVGLNNANDYLAYTDTEQWSQEITLSSNDWDHGNWLVGVSGFWEEVQDADHSLGWYPDPFAYFALPCGNGAPFDIACSVTESITSTGGIPKEIDRDTDSWSAFGLVGLDLTEQLRITAEARYTHDDVTVTTNTLIDRVSQMLLNVPFDLDFGGGAAADLPDSATVTSNSLNYRLAADYKVNDDVMLYASVGTSTKPGGFGTAQMGRPGAASMKPEELTAYEVGAKTTWLDGALQANAAVFFNEYEDRQVGVTVDDPVTGWPAAGIVNAGAAETKGFELDVLWQPIDELTLGMGYAYVDAEWTDFNYTEIRNAAGKSLTAKDQAICGNIVGDCSGADIIGIPENAWTLMANYTAPMANSNMEWFVNTSAQWNDERAVTDRINGPYIGSSWNVDIQAGLQSDTWSVMLYADNVLDDDSVDWGQGYQDFKDGMWGGTFGGEPRDESVMAFLPNPRVVGVRANIKFGGN